MKAGPVVYHVGGARSIYRHREALMAEKGADNVTLKDVFDRTHMKDGPSGFAYVNPRAEASAKLYEDIQMSYKGGLDEAEAWGIAVGGENRGRLFGFGYRSRARATRSGSRPQGTDPTRSTATSASTGKKTYTTEEVAAIMERQASRFTDVIGAQERRYTEEMSKLRKRHNEEKAHQMAMFEALFKGTGVKPPPPSMNGGLHASNADDGNNGDDNNEG